MTDIAPEPSEAVNQGVAYPLAATAEPVAPAPPGDTSVLAIDPSMTKIDIQNLDFFYGKGHALKLSLIHI